MLYEVITVFDSLNLSTGIGLQVMKAYRAAEAGKSIEEIMDLLHRTRPQVETEFVIDSLDYLYKGGRCSGMQNLVGSLLKIRPVIKVIDGKMTVITSYSIHYTKLYDVLFFVKPL